MRAAIRPALFVATALMMSAPALAGGVGLIGAGGIHTEKVWFYDRADDYRQYQLNQVRPSYGAGLEVTLGDRDDRVLGFFRAYWLQDSPQLDPADLTATVDPDNVEGPFRDTARNLGVGVVGTQVGLLGDPEGFQLLGIFGIGASFLTTDHTEFLLTELGVGGSYGITPAVQAYVNAGFTMRYQKRFSYGAHWYAGVRYLFD